MRSMRNTGHGHPDVCVRRIMHVGWIAAAVWMMGMISCPPEAHGQSNILENAGFESPTGGKMPDGWSYYTSDIERGGLSTNAATGTQCVRLTAQGAAGAFQGFYQIRPAVTGAHYRITARARSDPDNPLGTNAYLQLVIEWTDWAGLEITRYWSSNFDASFLKQRVWWTLPALDVTAPKSVAQGVFGFHLFDGGEGGTGAVLVDDVVVTELR